MTDRAKPIVVEQAMNVTAPVAWDAITNPDEMRKWYFENLPDFTPEPGFETRFPVSSEDRVFTHVWKVEEVVPGSMIRIHWSFEEYDGAGAVTFEVLDNGESTVVRVTNTGLDSFPDGIPEFSRESCVQGWTYFIRERLAEYLGGK